MSGVRLCQLLRTSLLSLLQTCEVTKLILVDCMPPGKEWGNHRLTLARVSWGIS